MEITANAGQIDAVETILWLMALVLLADRLASALGRLGLVPGRLQAWIQRRMAQSAERRAENHALSLLASQYDVILRELVPNDEEHLAHPEDRGKPMRTLLFETRAEVRDLHAGHEEGRRWRQAHDERHARNGGE